jgi:hypothetical protein
MNSNELIKYRHSRALETFEEENIFISEVTTLLNL